MPADDDARHRDHPNTIPEFLPATAPPVRVDLRRRLDHRTRAAIARDAAAALAERLRQLALFWYDGTRFWLLPAKAGEEALELPR